MEALARHPEVVEKIRAEIHTVMGDRTTVQFDDVKQFQYCEMVLKETLRMRPPVPFLDRGVAADTKLGKHVYKANVSSNSIQIGCRFLQLVKHYVYPFIIAAHFDNRYWKKPFEFRPERFDHSKGDDPAPHPFAFAPFSAGSRK